MGSRVIRLWGLVGLLAFMVPLWAAEVMVDGDWLEQRLGKPGLVVVDMSISDTQYQRFHLAGAVRLPYQSLVQKRRDGVSMRISDERLYAILGSLGITADTRVVIYDDMGGLQAARLFWELERIGHPQVSVLDGGLVQWILDGRKVDYRAVQPTRVRYQPGGGGRANDADIAMVEAAMRDPDGALLLDVRSEPEYRGSARNPRSGHIPGARWWPWVQAVRFDQGFVVVPAGELEESLQSLGVKRDRPVITYCRTGHRAAHTYLMLRRLGYEKVKMYDGSMAEWTRNKALPVKQGMEP